MLQIKKQDIRRATLNVKSGNEGWIGVSPKGDAYHIVVPVDVQIARGVMACNRPTDGTPFGGYAEWIYFRCPPYEADKDDLSAKEEQVQKTSEELIRRLAAYGIEVEIKDEPQPIDSVASKNHRPTDSEETIKALSKQQPVSDRIAPQFEDIICSGCRKRWARLSDFLRDSFVDLERYRAHSDDFRQGKYIFLHRCGARLELDVSRFVRPVRQKKSLAGTHACPGFCYYETSLRSCSASCEGSCYRKIAEKLKSRSKRAR